MNYKSYRLARDLAWEMLIWFKINELPIKVMPICKEMGIELVYDKNVHGKADGYCTIINGTPYIGIDPALDLQNKRYTAAHELGHILLGHVGEYDTVYHNGESSTQEQEADIFASRFLAPACVLWGCNARTAEEIRRICNISLPEAELRAKRLEELCRRNAIISLPTERRVFSQFKEFIDRVRQDGSHH